jgi:hypothetical protein
MTTQPPLYDPNTPEFPSDSFATSQPQLLDNFQALFNAFVTNHISLDATSNAGNHTNIQLIEQENPLQTDASEINVYTKDAPGQTDQIFLRYQGNGVEFQYTNYQLYSIPNFIGQTTNFTFLPGRVIVYFGALFQPNVKQIFLYPQIARKIISISLVSSGPIASKVSVALVTSPTGIITQVVPDPMFPSFITPQNYIVMANV